MKQRYVIKMYPNWGGIGYHSNTQGLYSSDITSTEFPPILYMSEEDAKSALSSLHGGIYEIVKIYIKE